MDKVILKENVTKQAIPQRREASLERIYFRTAIDNGACVYNAFAKRRSKNFFQ
jgi:hypothetical protein